MISGFNELFYFYLRVMGGWEEVLTVKEYVEEKNLRKRLRKRNGWKKLGELEMISVIEVKRIVFLLLDSRGCNW